MNSRLRAAIRLTLLASFASGCGSGGADPGPAPASPSASTDRRIKFKEEYRQALGKDGRVVMKPGLMKKYKAAAPDVAKH